MTNQTVSQTGGQAIRRIVLEQSKRANVGHIGSALSIADIVAALYSHVLQVGSPTDPKRDRFILSKGHAALALYAALHLRGWLSRADLDSFCGDGTLLAVHPEHVLSGVDFSTGSLGQGLAVGAGAALASRLQQSTRRVFVLLSDAECNEGSVWESAAFAAHHSLANLVAVVDSNGQQALGYTRDILEPSPLAERWASFGWEVTEVDGHDEAALVGAFDALETERGRPHVVIAHTTFGKGVSFMENQIKWHYLPMSDADFQLAMTEVDGASCAARS